MASDNTAGCESVSRDRMTPRFVSDPSLFLDRGATQWNLWVATNSAFDPAVNQPGHHGGSFASAELSCHVVVRAL